MNDDVIVFGGSAQPALARAIGAALGVELGARTIERFPDGEVHVRIDESVRGKEVFVVQPTSPPVDRHLVELLAFVDAARRAAAERISAVVPYFGYARADKRHEGREPIAARMVADLLEAAGVHHLVTLDLHAAQVEGFFHVPVDNLTARPLLVDALRPSIDDETVVVSPDAGRVKMASRYAGELGRPLVVLHKRRTSGARTEVTHVAGEVRGRSCVIVDDIISTGGTIARGARALVDAGARPPLTVAAAHGLLLRGAMETMAEAGVGRVVVTDTVPVEGGARHERPEVRVVSVARLIARAIRRFLADGSLRELYG